MLIKTETVLSLKMTLEEEDLDILVKQTIIMCAHDATKRIRPEELISFLVNGPREKDPKEDAKM